MTLSPLMRLLIVGVPLAKETVASPQRGMSSLLALIALTVMQVTEISVGSWMARREVRLWKASVEDPQAAINPDMI